MRKGISLVAASVVMLLAWTVWVPGVGSASTAPPTIERDIEVMRGILQTTVSYATRGAAGTHPDRRFHHADVDGYYVPGQGAMFVVVVPGPEYLLSTHEHLAELEGAYSGMLVRAEEMQARGEYLEQLAEEEQARAEDELERAKAQLAAAAEERRKIVEQLEAKQEAERQEREKLTAEYGEELKAITDSLVDALAVHGDSIAALGPNEHVTLIVRPERHVLMRFGEEAHLSYEVLSVAKSTVTSHKAGKLSLDDFRARVARYSQ